MSALNQIRRPVRFFLEFEAFRRFGFFCWGLAGLRDRVASVLTKFEDSRRRSLFNSISCVISCLLCDLAFPVGDRQGYFFAETHDSAKSFIIFFKLFALFTKKH